MKTKKKKSLDSPADDVSDVMLLPRIGGIAEEALFAILQMGDDAVAFGYVEAACRGRVELIRATDQQVARRWVARALLARVYPSSRLTYIIKCVLRHDFELV